MDFVFLPISFYGIKCLKNEIVNAGYGAKIAFVALRFFVHPTP
jgi:hypothetical protein